MTQSPTPPPIPPPAPPAPLSPVVPYRGRAPETPLTGPSRRPPALGEIIAWIVILITVATIFTVPLILKRRAAARLAASQKIDPPDVQFLLEARYLVGLNALMPAKSSGTSGTMADTLGAAAKSPADELRILIVRAEIESPEAIQDDLDRLAARSEFLQPDIDTLRKFWTRDLPENSPEWQTFREHHGWFADLAASQGRPAADPLRTATINAGVRTFVSLVAAMMVALGLTVAGMGLLIWGGIWFFTKRLQPRFNRGHPLPADRRSYVEGFAIYLAVYAFLGLLIRLILLWLPQLTSGLWSAVVLPLAFGLGLAWPLMRGQSWRQWRAALGLHAGAGFFREMLAGAAGYIGGLPLLAAGFLITSILTKITGIDATHPIVNELGGSPWELCVLIFLACVFAPITEELMFRGALFAHLRERFGFWISALGVSFIFAIIHPQGWTALPVLGSIGFTLATIREWRGSIVAGMTAHSLNNGAVLVLTLLMLS